MGLDSSQMPRVDRLSLFMSNVYLVRAAACLAGVPCAGFSRGAKASGSGGGGGSGGAILVDTGCPGQAHRILRWLARLGVRPADLSLILLTHGHADHFGSAAQLRQHTGAPVAVHHLDAQAVRSGQNGPVHPMKRGLFVGLLSLIAPDRAPAVQPDILIRGSLSLEPFGVDGRVIPTPGHTPGSVSVVLAGGRAIVGDLIMGGALGGKLFPGLPGFSYFVDDVDQTHASLRDLMRLPLTRVYVGHGGPLDPAAITRRFASQVGLGCVP